MTENEENLFFGKNAQVSVVIVIIIIFCRNPYSLFLVKWFSQFFIKSRQPKRVTDRAQITQQTINAILWFIMHLFYFLILHVVLQISKLVQWYRIAISDN